MDIAFVINDAYAHYTRIALFALISAHKKSQEMHFHILHKDLSPQSRAMLAEYISGHSGKSLSFYDVKDEDLSAYQMTIPHTSIETYFKLLLPSVLSSLDKVLCLDVDALVRKDISALWDVPLEDKFAGVIFDPQISFSKNEAGHEFLGNGAYFNAGVLLLNLKEIRAKGLDQAFQSLYLKHKEKLRYQEQDLLNVVFAGRCVWLSPDYNLMMAYYHKDNHFQKLETFSPDEYQKFPSYKDDPSIIHYTGAPKPWDKSCVMPHRELYIQVWERSPWPVLGWPEDCAFYAQKAG